jgi:hypothetical protein
MIIYHDSLGRPEPRGDISLTHGLDADYWYLHSTSDAQERKWPAGTPVDTIVHDMDMDGWDTIISYPHHGCPPVIDCIHRDTAHALSDHERGAVDCYIRYGDLPRGGRSRNHDTNEYESGISVYRGKMYPDGSWAVDAGINQGAWCLFSNRPVYLVSGREIGTGSDGEPVLADCVVDRRLDLAIERIKLL